MHFLDCCVVQGKLSQENHVGGERRKGLGFSETELIKTCRVKCWRKDNYTKTELQKYV